MEGWLPVHVTSDPGGGSCSQVPLTTQSRLRGALLSLGPLGPLCRGQGGWLSRPLPHGRAQDPVDSRAQGHKCAEGGNLINHGPIPTLHKSEPLSIWEKLAQARCLQDAR